MRTLLLTGLLLIAAAAALAPSAGAQQSGHLMLYIEPPLEPLTEGGMVTLHGVATLTVDVTAYTSLSGIPIHYLVRGPEWTTVVVTPAQDVFQLSSVPTGTAAYASRPFSITVAASELDADVTGIVELEGITTPGFAGVPIHGIGQTFVSYDAPEPPEDDDCDLLTPEQKAALLEEGAEMYNAYQAQEAQSARDDGDDVSVQNTGATLMPSPWIAVMAFGLVGAGVGLFLRRKLRP